MNIEAFSDKFFGKGAQLWAEKYGNRQKWALLYRDDDGHTFVLAYFRHEYAARSFCRTMGLQITDQRGES